MTHFEIPAGKREALTAAQAEELLSKIPSDATSVKLSGKSFGDGSAQVAAEVLSSLKDTLKKLDISDIIASRPEDEAKRALSTISNALSECTNITHLNLSDNALGAKGVRALSTLLRAPNALHSVSFCNNGLAADACLLIANALLPSAKSLRQLYFHNNLSETAGAKALAPLFRACTQLKVLRFSALRVARPGCVTVCNAIAPALKAGALRDINLADNSFGAQGARALENALKEAVALERLVVRDCLLGNNGVAKVVRALIGKEKLRVLDVSGNEAKGNAACAVKELLENERCVVEQILLEDNEFGSKGAVHIANGIKFGKELKVVVLNSCEIGGRGAKALAHAVDENGSVEKIELDGNFVPATDLEEVQGLLGDRLGDMDENDGDAEDEEEEVDESEEDEDEEEEEEEEDDDDDGVQDGVPEDSDENGDANGVAVDAVDVKKANGSAESR